MEERTTNTLLFQWKGETPTHPGAPLIFQMTSFETEHNLTNHGFFTTFKIQGQCYHKIGLIKILDEETKFVQVYFMGNTQEEAKQQNRHVGGNLDVNIITELQEMLN